MECKEPIRARSTFHEAVVLGKTHRKELKATCGKSTLEESEQGYCLDCYLKLKKQFKKIECDCKTCIKMKDGICQYLVGE
jgi:hypothetical protein